MLPEALSKAEDALVHTRRSIAGVAGDVPRIGVACSGGGIRSATLCLGVFQALAKNDLLRSIDYISTISGGGYFGSFLGSAYRPHTPEEDDDAKSIVARVAADLAHDQSPPIKWLRKNGRYIAPNGPADYFNIAGIYIRNWVGVQYIVGVTFLTLFLLMIVGRGFLAQQSFFEIFSSQGVTHVAGQFFILWSPLFALPLLIFPFVSIPLAWAFWLTQYGADDNGLLPIRDSTTAKRRLRDLFRNNLAWWATVFVILVCVLALRLRGWPPVHQPGPGELALSMIAFTGILSIACWLITELLVSRRPALRSVDRMSVQRRQGFTRNLLSDRQGLVLKVIAALVGIALIDTLAQSLYAYVAVAIQHPAPALAVSSVITALLAVVHQIAPLLQRTKSIRSTWSIWSIASALGLAMLVFILVMWDVAAYALVFHGESIDWTAQSARSTAIAYLSVGIPLTLLTGSTMSFLNLSSLQGFYAARLRRAYLGASNPARTDAKPTRALSIRRDAVGDDRSWADYKPHAAGGPLHLLGVTVNHTIGKGSDIDLRDRKGYTMTIGPCGMSAGIDSHAQFTPDMRAIEPIECPGGSPVFGHPGCAIAVETCSLSRWMAISGAAFSTGLGANTRTGVSVLLGTANVRLGYWWASGARVDDPASLVRSAFRVQSYLTSEFLGRFAGNAFRHWYLSDGGHSENTGAYELVRRRLPIIVLLDHGADPDYAFDDFGNLVRRVRVDFGVEIAPLPSSEHGRWGIDEAALTDGLTGLRRDHVGNMGVATAKHSLALFSVTYPSGSAQSLLILAKPTLTGDEPADVTNYAVSHAAFPQEPTSDQFFDEAQWESYRRLGEHIGDRLSPILDKSRAARIAGA